MALVVGQEFAGYRIERVLGAGGMGEVYLATHPRLPRRDALKVLPTRLCTDEAFRRRFIREADLAAGIDHPNVVAVYDRGEFNDQLWITMRYVEGHDLATELGIHPTGLPAESVAHIVTEVADALDHAHAHNLLHRDVKPANILLTEASGVRGRRVMLADFGIARPILDDTRLTATNLTVGSFAYCSPEQLAGTDIDGRADQYSLACTAFQLLGGSTPFAHSNAAALIHHHLSVSPPPITARRPDLSPRVDDVLARALEKDARQRYSTCSGFASELATALRSTAVPHTPRPTANAAPTFSGPIPHRPGGHHSAPRYAGAPKAVAGVSPSDTRARKYARWSLICGVASIPLGCFAVPGLVLAGLALHFGTNSLRLTRGNAYPYTPAVSGGEKGMAIAGLTIGAIGIVWSIIMVIGFIGGVSTG